MLLCLCWGLAEHTKNSLNQPIGSGARLVCKREEQSSQKIEWLAVMLRVGKSWWDAPHNLVELEMALKTASKVWINRRATLGRKVSPLELDYKNNLPHSVISTKVSTNLKGVSWRGLLSLGHTIFESSSAISNLTKLCDMKLKQKPCSIKHVRSRESLPGKSLLMMLRNASKI